MAESETNAKEALEAFGSSPTFDPLNHEKGSGWKGLEGNADAAIGEFGGVEDAGKVNAILREGPAEIPSNATDSPTAANKQPY